MKNHDIDEGKSLFWAGYFIVLVGCFLLVFIQSFWTLIPLGFAAMASGVFTTWIEFKKEDEQ